MFHPRIRNTSSIHNACWTRTTQTNEFTPVTTPGYERGEDESYREEQGRCSHEQTGTRGAFEFQKYTSAHAANSSSVTISSRDCPRNTPSSFAARPTLHRANLTGEGAYSQSKQQRPAVALLRVTISATRRKLLPRTDSDDLPTAHIGR